MGRARRRTEIKLIEAPTSRQVTFLNRQRGLFKKADELTVLCNAEVAVIVFSCTGKLYKYSNCGLKHTIRRYEKETGFAMGSPDQRDVEELQSVIVGGEQLR